MVVRILSWIFSKFVKIKKEKTSIPKKVHSQITMASLLLSLVHQGEG